MNAPDRLRKLLAEPGLIVMPAVWDGLTAKRRHGYCQRIYEIELARGTRCLRQGSAGEPGGWAPTCAGWPRMGSCPTFLVRL